MKSISIFKNILLCVIISQFTTNISAQSIEKNFAENQVIVMFNNLQNTSAKSSFETDYKEYLSTSKLPSLLSEDMNCWLYFLNENKATEKNFIDFAKNNVSVKAIQLNHFVQERSMVPNDILFAQQWDLNNTGQGGGLAGADISAVEAWDITTGGFTATGDTIVAAVVDGGADFTHNDLDFWKNYADNPNDTLDNDSNGYVNDYKGWNAINNNNIMPTSGSSYDHGTHVSGTIAALGNNNIGIAGINWHTKIMTVNGSSSLESAVVIAYGYVLKQRKIYNQTNGAKGAFVVSTNSSFGVNNGQPSAFPIWCAFYDSLGSQGILSAAATANANFNIDVTSDIPTACVSDFLVTVTNTTKTDAKYSSAAYGHTTIDLGAPGTNTLSTTPNNNYGTKTGTSMATPHVAGAIALMISAGNTTFINAYKQSPAIVALIIKEQLLLGVDSINSLDAITVSGGRLNLFKAVNRIKNYPDSLLNFTNLNKNKVPEINFLLQNVTPNPANNFIEISYKQNQNSKLYIEFYDAIGNLISAINKNNIAEGLHNCRVDISFLNNGIYFVKLNNGSIYSNTQKLIVVKN